MKLKFIFALLIALVFGSTVRAIDGVIDENALSSTLPAEASINNDNASEVEIKPLSPNNQIDDSATSNASTVNASSPNVSTSDLSMSQTMGAGKLSAEDTATTMAWPAIPGESLNDIARLFYPKNKVMRQQFLAETLALNADIEPKLKASNQFAEPTLLQIPTLKSLSKKASAIQAKRAKLKRQNMQLSYNINQAVSKLPAFLLQEYEALLAKNAFLKAELERLHARLGVLQDKFNSLKLVFDKTLRLPANVAGPETKEITSNVASSSVANTVTTPVIAAETPVVVQAAPVKKVFKNLNQAPTVAAPAGKLNNNLPQSSDLQQAAKPVAQPAFDWLRYGLLALLALMALLSAAAYFMRQKRLRLLDQFNNSKPMDDTLTDFDGVWQDTEQELAVQSGAARSNHSASASGFLNSEMLDEQAKASSTLEEAKLLMSINRTQDAIAHLKLTIEAQPKVSINHWLYLLEIFRKQNAKAEFEQYAKSLHIMFNVMTPIWYDAEIANADAQIIVPQHLEDFPHIMEKLDAVWPSELARVYLESLITDNRDGERSGFSHGVLNEILLLISLLDARKALEQNN